MDNEISDIRIDTTLPLYTPQKLLLNAMCKLYFIQLKTIKSNAFDNDFLKKAGSFHNTSKVHILLFSDLVTVTKLPPNLSKSTVEKHRCSICERGYSFQSGLSKHIRSGHNNV